MIDKIIVIALLRILKQTKGHMMPETVLFNHINIDLASPAQPSLLQEQLIFAKDKGWVDYQVDEFKIEKWWITSAGEVQLSNQI